MLVSISQLHTITLTQMVHVQLLAMVSQPVKAVILLFPITEPYENKRREEDIWIAGSGQHPIDPTVFWMKQTVRLAIY